MTLPLPDKQRQHSVPSNQAASTIMTSASSARTPLTTNAPRARRPENRHSETSPLLGSISASKRIPEWGTLVQQLDREQFALDNNEHEVETISESGRTDEGGKNGSHIQLAADPNDSRDPRGKSKDSPFLDMESGRASPMGDSFVVAPTKRKSLPARVKQRTKYYVPVTSWLPEYEWSTFGGDFTAGMSVACLIIPQAMSYASGLAKLNPVAGIYSVAIPGIVYALLGTCRQLSVGPEAALSLLVGQLVTDALTADPHHAPKNPEGVAMAIAGITAMQVGMITFFLGIFRMGFLDVVLSRALLRGFITAIGIIIFIEQMVPMLGLAQYVHGNTITPFEKLILICSYIGETNLWTAGLSLVSLTWLIGARLFKQHLRAKVPALKYIPEIFILVVVSTIVTDVYKLDLKGITVLGKLEAGSGLPFGLPFQPKLWKYAHETFPTAAVIAVIGYVDSVMAAKENSAKFGYPISANRELVALGASNFAVSFCTGTGCVPAFGSITRSRLNANIGGRSQMSSIITSIFAIMTLFLLQYFHYLPKAVLASIVVVVVYSILAEVPHEISFYWRSRAKTDALQAAMTFLLTLLFSVEVGLVASVAFSLILVIQKSTKPRIKIIGRVRETDEWIPVDENPDAIEEDLPGVLVIRIRENLNFANTGQLKERLRRLELYGADLVHPSEAPKRDHAHAIVFHMNDVEDIDSSALQIVLELVKSYKDRGVELYFVHLRSKQIKAFERVGLLDLLDHTHFTADLRTAMRNIEETGSFRAGA
ncbi:hypothetical protein FFLO_03959 [Filobasidium floriforme]|uniref:STAS domain-containing protein n=1 Tax=Filobasidium floriforme TaxID=5210 RepID=A0A8K0NQB6_9TREE|nr:hypothetical protein FFLO_03959 [Filobasidium floriforme]